LKSSIHLALFQVRSASTAYGSVIFGKIRIPCQQDAFIHVRCVSWLFFPRSAAYTLQIDSIHDTPGEGQNNVKFHSILTDERRDSEGNVVDYEAFQTREKPLEFFNE
jgi:hypothetical protein